MRVPAGLYRISEVRAKGDEQSLFRTAFAKAISERLISANISPRRTTRNELHEAAKCR